MFLRKQLESGAEHFIPNSFLRRAVAHIERTGEPLLYQRLPRYSEVLEAWPDEDGYTLNVPMEEWEPPFRTWREYAEFKGVPLQNIMDERDFEDESQLDEEIELYFLDQMVDAEHTIHGLVEGLLGDLPQYLIEDAGDLKPLLQRTVVEIYENDGRFPGDLWTGHSKVFVPSKLALSILQYVLDEIGSSIRIELKP